MKKIALLLLLFLPAWLAPFFIQVMVSPSDATATLAWNLGLALAPVLAFIAQFKLIKERQLPVFQSFTVIALVNAALVIGSRAGAWTGQDWQRILSGEGAPELPGKTVMGGLLLALAVFALLRKYWKLPAGLLDVLVLGMPLAAVVARAGCMLAGCCYGAPTGSDWGVCYGPGTPAYGQGTDIDSSVATALLYPVQWWLVVGNAFIFIVLWQFRKKMPQAGALACMGLGLLMFQRFGMEFLRDVATNRGGFGLYWAGLKAAQWVALSLSLISFAGLWRILTRAPKMPVVVRSMPIRHEIMSAWVFVLSGLVLVSGQWLTLDERAVIMLSCIPPLLMLAAYIWRTYQRGDSVLSSLSMLSFAAVLLVIAPIDTIKQVRYTDWEQGIEAGSSFSTGSFQHISKDCDGNVLDEEKINVNYPGLMLGGFWKKGNQEYKLTLKGSAGKFSSTETNDRGLVYSFSTIGISGSAQWNWFGLSLGVMNLNKRFGFAQDLPYKEHIVLPIIGARIGNPGNIFFDVKIFDEPTLGLNLHTPFSMSMNYGFHDPSGLSTIRAGLALSPAPEIGLVLGGNIPIIPNKLGASLNAHLGKASMFNFGLKYRFSNQQ